MSDLKIFCEGIEPAAFEQIQNLASYEAYGDSKIRIMPDCHAGKGCTVGTTMTIHGKVTPNLVGVDIGCGMLVVEIGPVQVSFEKMERIISRKIPSGMNIRTKPVPETEEALALVDALCCKHSSGERPYNGLSIGTLGGGNHFIEIDCDDDGNMYLVIHTGSRNLGKKVCDYYQLVAEKECFEAKDTAAKELIARLKAEGHEKDIHTELGKLPKVVRGPADPLAYLSGRSFDEYIHDMDLCQRFAELNRKTIARVITEGLKLEPVGEWQTVHNYIDIENMMLRKGSISAREGERVIIPMNMRDGSLICIGKGNPDWNFSAPHGAGRLMSRAEAVRRIELSDFRKDMEGIASWSVCDTTVDEAPGVYKPMGSIVRQIEPTVRIEKIIRPVYNYKAH